MCQSEDKKRKNIMSSFGSAEEVYPEIQPAGIEKKTMPPCVPRRPFYSNRARVRQLTVEACQLLADSTRQTYETGIDTAILKIGFTIDGLSACYTSHS